MKTLYVDTAGKDYPVCPLRDDLDRCRGVEGSGYNYCPACDGELN